MHYLRISICNPSYLARRGVSTPNALRPTGMGVISRKLVTWVKDALCFKLYVYILKKRKEDNNPNPRKLTLNIRTKYCFLPIKAPSSMFSYIEHITRKVY